MNKLASLLLGFFLIVNIQYAEAKQNRNWRIPIPNSVGTVASNRLDSLYASGCQPFRAKSIDYDGCPGEAPPPRDDMYQVAKTRGFIGTREKLIEACQTNAHLCIVDPIPHDCPTGAIWSNAGGIAHCVRVDPVCVTGYELDHDALGNPFCKVKIVTPPKCSDVLSTETAICSGGQPGVQTRTVSTNSCTNVVSYGVWDTSQCGKTCTDTFFSESASCTGGQSGTQTREVITNSCTSTPTYGPWDTSGCTGTCTATSISNTETAQCDPGFSGEKKRKYTTNSCTGKVLQVGPWDTSGCSTCKDVPSVETVACDVGYIGDKTRNVMTNQCTGTVTPGTWDTSQCTKCKEIVSTEYAACDAGFSGTKSRAIGTDSCSGLVTYMGAWTTSECVSLIPECASDEFWDGTMCVKKKGTGEGVWMSMVNEVKPARCVPMTREVNGVWITRMVDEWSPENAAKYGPDMGNWPNCSPRSGYRETWEQNSVTGEKRNYLKVILL